MSTQVDTAFVQQYGATVFHLSQQKMSRLRGTVRVESITGEFSYFDRIGLTTAHEITGRHADTPQNDTPHSRRRLGIKFYNNADQIDTQDKLRMLMEPAGHYVRAFAASFGRTMDSVIIEAFEADVATGKTGTGSASYDTNNTVGVQVGGSSSDVGLNVEKLRAAKEILDAGEVDPDAKRYIALNAKQLRNLLAETEVTSSDYNTVKALVQGELDTFVGFKFIRTELIGVDANADHKVPFWSEEGMILGMAQEPRVEIGPRPDKNYNTQVYMEMGLGAIRMEEAQVGLILCDPT
jgi:hypothetical protein